MDKKRIFTLLEKFFPLLLSIIAAVVYLLTLAPSVVEIDSGELAAVQYNLGVAHPTGYPLFSILGWLFSHIPLGMSKIYQLNLLALLYCTGAIFLFSKAMQVFLKNWNPKVKRSVKAKKSSSTKKRSSTKKPTSKKTTAPKSDRPKAAKDKDQRALFALLSNLISVAAGTVLLAFSTTFWIQSTSVEVYSLHLLLLNLVLLCTLNFFYDTTGNKREAIFLGLALGLLFANHLSAIMLLPGLIILLLFKFFSDVKKWFNYLIMGATSAVVVVLSYGFLMIRAISDPILNWGDPSNLEFLIRHTSGQQFQIWLFESEEATQANLDNFFARLPEEFLFPASLDGNYTLGIALAIIGLGLGALVFLLPRLKFRSTRLPLFLFFAITAIFTVAWAINYNINDLESYFLLCYIMIGFWMVALWKWILEQLPQKTPVLIASAALVVILGGVQIGVNFPKADKSEVYAYHDYTLAAMESLPQDAILFSYQWDHLISPSYYFQFVEGKRTDIAIIDTEILTNRRWYFDQLESNYPGLLKAVPGEVEIFKKELLKFEREDNPDVRILGTNLQAIFSGIITGNAPKSTAFVAPEVAETNLRQGGSMQLPPGYVLIPHHFFYQIAKTQEYIPLEDRDFSIRLGEKPGLNEPTDNRIEYIREVRAKLLRDRALYDLSYGKPAEAQIRVDRLHNEYPWFPLPTPLQNMLTQ